MGRRLGHLATVIAAAGLLTCGSAAAATLPNATISRQGQVITWQGKSSDPTGQGYGPPTEQSCTSSTCDSFLLTVNVPADTFPKGPQHPAPPGITRVQSEGPTDMPGDGVLITIKWATDFDQWNLYVDDMSTGQTVAQGIDVDSNAQSVLLSQPHNGVYRVTMVPFYTDFNTEDLKYSGEASVFHDPSQRIPLKAQLLPRLDTVAPSNFHIADVPPVTSNPTGWRFTPDGTFSNSCYLDETAQYGSTRCLRFDNNIRNVGNGPLVLRFAYSPDAFAGNCEMTQEILATDASVSDRPAGPCVFHTQHAHFHYQNMGLYELYAVGSDGRPGANPVAASHKVGFCTIDVDDYNFGQPAALQRPRIYSFPTCNIPNAYSTQLPASSPYGPSGVPEYMGISPGWGDVYTWDLPQQYIDVSHIGDGTYEVVSRSNFDGGILTSDRGEETGITCIRMKGNTVQVLKELPSQSDSAPLPSCQGASASSASTPAAVLPAARTCTSRRHFAIHLRAPRRQRLVRATVFVDGHRVRVLHGLRLHAAVNLTGLPRGRFSVLITAVTNRGRHLRSVRRYRTCVPGPARSGRRG